MAVKRYNGTSWDTVAGLGAQGAAATSSSITTWVKTAAGGETSLTGSSDSSTTLAYTAGQEQLFINGVLQVRGSDYTATNGTSITGLTALVAGDIATVTTVNAFSVTGAVPLSTVTANGDLIVGTSSGAVGRLGIGSTGQLLTVSGGVPTWAAAPAAGGMTLISTTSLSGTSTVLSSIPQTYKHLFLTVTNVTGSAADSMQWRFNGNSSNNYTMQGHGEFNGAFNSTGAVNLNRIEFDDFISQNAMTGTANLYITNYTSTSATLKTVSGWQLNRYTDGRMRNIFWAGRYQQTSAISSITLQSNGVVTFTGTVELYGVN
jgi:hypothetical protein